MTTVCSARVRTPEQEPVDGLRVGQGQLLRDRAAHGDAEDGGAGEPGSVQDGARIQGHPLDGVRPFGPGTGASDATVVEPDGREVRSEPGQLAPPHIARVSQPHDQQ